LIIVKLTACQTSRVCSAGLLGITFALALPVVVRAQFSYVTNGGRITITGYTGPGGIVTIPPTINGLSVTSIGEEAFFRSTNLNTVNIPASVTRIEPSAFEECYNLTTVNIPDTVNFIGNQAFEECYSLTTVSIPRSLVTIEEATFSNCASLTNFNIPTNVTAIGGWAFERCFSLSRVTIGKSVTNVGSYAFLDCRSLAGIYFEGNAPSTNPDVFGGATNATVYFLPGTTGWSSTFGGRLTAVWRPLIKLAETRFGTHSFGFTIDWAADKIIVVETSTNLAGLDWFATATNTLTEGWSYFSDPHWTNYPNRFYRLRLP
jgi:hypothetical protein